MKPLARQAAEVRRADAAEHESDHQRWADDGGFMPEPAAATPATLAPVLRTPWAAIGVAVGVGLAVGWLTTRRDRARAVRPVLHSPDSN